MQADTSRTDHVCEVCGIMFDAIVNDARIDDKEHIFCEQHFNEWYDFHEKTDMFKKNHAKMWYAA